MTMSHGDEYMRQLQRAARAGDPEARRRLHLERRRRGLPLPRKGGGRAYRQARSLLQEVAELQRLFAEAEGRWTGLDWTVDDYSFSCREHDDLDGKRVRGCPDCDEYLAEYARTVAASAEAARESARFAMEALFAGDARAADAAADETYRLENQYGDTPVWGAWHQKMMEILERTRR